MAPVRRLLAACSTTRAALDASSACFALLPIRLLLAWEFTSAGIGKRDGENWFGNVQEQFLFPFDLVPAAISWFLATWTEILGGVCLGLGLATRFWAAALIAVTVQAIAAVHWPKASPPSPNCGEATPSPTRVSGTTGFRYCSSQCSCRSYFRAAAS